jgi:hypothetical protein
MWENDEFQPPCPAIALAASENANLPALLLDARRYAHQNGFGKIVINARLSSEMDSALVAAGFARESDDSNYEYEREHPTRPTPLAEQQRSRRALNK